ncbi:MAG: HD domain-containing protein [Nitrospirae bacterium]|nr:HD domain-containing protein [Nitrospirota bacterium]
MDSKEKDIVNTKDIINQFTVIVRTAYIHDPGNIAVTTAMDRFIALTSPFIEAEGELMLDIRGEFFYINDKRVRYPLEFLPNFDFLSREFRRRGLGSIAFKDTLQHEDIRTFLKAFITSMFSETTFETLEESMSGIDSIKVGKLKKIKTAGEGEPDVRRVVKKIYFNAVSHTRAVMSKLKAGEEVSMRKTKRVVESMVDLILEEEQLLIGMTSIKDYDEYTYNHSVNVSILSVALGQRIGLSRKALTELGIVALFHDIGKIEIPKEILNKSTSFTEQEWDTVKKHPFWGVRALLRMKKIDYTSIRSAITSFEHHMYCDLSGYPKPRQPLKLDFYSKIVALADNYDGMTSSRVYARIPMPPDKALSLMMEKAGTQLDPILFKFFTNMMGIFPIGTLVMLDTKELGLVYQSSAMFLNRPKILVIINSKEKKVDSYVVDLTEKDSDGKFVRTIVKTLDPNRFKVNLADYLL